MARHEAWHRLHGADCAGVSEADVGALKIFDCQFVRTNFANDFVVRKQEAGEVERVGVAQHWDNKCALAFALVHIDSQTDVDVGMLLQHWLAIGVNRVTVLHVWHVVGNCANDGVTNDVSETDFALPNPRAVVVHYLAVDFQQFRWHIAETCCGRNREALFHVCGNSCRHAAQWFGRWVWNDFGCQHNAWRRWFNAWRRGNRLCYWRYNGANDFGCGVGLRGAGRFEVAEELLPGWANGGWVFAESLVHLFDKPRVGAKFFGARPFKHRIHRTLPLLAQPCD